MATRGKKPQTAAQKAAKGERRPSRVNRKVVELPLLERAPEPPGWMNTGGRELWGRLVPQLFGARVLSVGDLPALEHLCQLHGEILAAYKRGETAPASHLAQLRIYFAEFGLTPSARSRLPSPERHGEPNPFTGRGEVNRGRG